MNLFLQIIIQMLPLYLIIVLGYVGGRYLSLNPKNIATLTIYLVAPVVFFLSIQQMEFKSEVLLIPVGVIIISVGLSLMVLYVTKFFLGEKLPYLSALMTGTSNCGYFGMPIAFALFDNDIAAVYILVCFSTTLFENSFGVYFISRGRHSPWQSLMNVGKFPALYAIITGLLLSYLNYRLPLLSGEFFTYFKGAYVVLGMMLIGCGLAAIKRKTIDLKFIATVLSVKFIVWPFLAVAIIYVDQNFLHSINSNFYAPFLLFSCMPMAANNIAFAAKFDMNPGKAAVATLASALLASGFVPVFLNLFWQ